MRPDGFRRLVGMSAQYQVTLEWGPAAMRAAVADVVVIADADRGPATDELHDLAPRTALVLDATLASASAVLAWARQTARWGAMRGSTGTKPIHRASCG